MKVYTIQSIWVMGHSSGTTLPETLGDVQHSCRVGHFRKSLGFKPPLGSRRTLLCNTLVVTVVLWGWCLGGSVLAIHAVNMMATPEAHPASIIFEASMLLCSSFTRNLLKKRWRAPDLEQRSQDPEPPQLPGCCCCRSQECCSTKNHSALNDTNDWTCCLTLVSGYLITTACARNLCILCETHETFR